jgi:hypothetical protein
MKNKYSVYIFSISIILCLNQCSKCHDKELSSMAFSQDDLNIIPYRNSDILEYISSTDDTLRLGGGYRKTENIVIMENYTSSDAYALYNCRGQWYNSQINLTEFSKNEAMCFQLELTLPNLFHCCKEKEIQIFCWNSDTSVSNFVSAFKFDNFGISNSFSTYNNGIVEGYQDTLFLGPKTFYNVYKLYNDPDSYTQSKYHDWIQRIYYSFAEGIVGFSLKSGKYYYFEKKL